MRAMNIISIALKDLQILFKDRNSMLSLFLLPFLFIFLFICLNNVTKQKSVKMFLV